MAAAGLGARPRVVIIGAGAAGTLTALHLVRAAGRRSTGLEVVLVDPADRWGRGVAFGTPDTGHLLNVAASGMSALPEDPAHFVSWRSRQRSRPDSDPTEFAPRRQFALYLDDTLGEAIASTTGLVALHHHRSRATAVRRTERGCAVATAEGDVLDADAAVVATGLPAVGHSWAPDPLRHSAFFVADPWLPGALDVLRRDHAGPADVLMVGTGLTMVDVAFSVTGPGSRSDRRLHAASRHARLPRAHVAAPKLAAIPDVSHWGSTLAAIRVAAQRHLRQVEETTGDWRPAVDGLRFQVSALWERLSEQDRHEFLRHDAGAWNVLRHRMAPSSAVRMEGMQADGHLTLHAAEVLEVEPLPNGGLTVVLSDGDRLDVGWVVNCTGPQSDIRLLGDALLDDLLRPRAGASMATPATAGMGFRTVHGRLLDSAGTTDAPVWTLGALRRGELWESTAVPEIRAQALALATSVMDAVAPRPRRLEDGRLVGGHHPLARPRDPLGLPLSTTAEAAAAYSAGLERVMRLQSGGERLIREAASLDPHFALAHAALAMLGHEAGADVDVRASLAAAREAVVRRGDARENSLVDVVARRVEDVRLAGAQALTSHLASYPRDVLAVSAAVPTIAFSGITDVRRESWELIEGLAPEYGDHWWYISLLAFTRQDQSRFEEAGLLAESALSCEPSSGHAVHALSHVMYETGQHEAGRLFLDHWVSESGRSASHRAHFSWHAALHELALGDVEAVRQRYYAQLTPPGVNGVRALVDAASLLWRWQVTTAGWDDATQSVSLAPAFASAGSPPPVEPVLRAVSEEMLVRPQTPFMGLHAAFALAAGRDAVRLEQLRSHCRRSADAVLRTIVTSVCDALLAVNDRRWGDAATLLAEVQPVLAQVGGSAAQREVIEETLLLCLLQDARSSEVAERLSARLSRRPSPLDRRRLHSLQAAG